MDSRCNAIPELVGLNHVRKVAEQARESKQQAAFLHGLGEVLCCQCQPWLPFLMDGNLQAETNPSFLLQVAFGQFFFNHWPTETNVWKVNKI